MQNLFLVNSNKNQLGFTLTSFDRRCQANDLTTCLVTVGCEIRTVEGVATRMIQYIQNLQPDGPFRLAGIGMGALVAHEIAMQLIGRDQNIDFLGIIDSSPESLGSWTDCYSAGYTSHSISIPIHLFASPRSTGQHEASLRHWSSVFPNARIYPGQVVNSVEFGELTTALTAAAYSANTKHNNLLENCYSPLVPMQSGRAGIPALFCIPGAGAVATCFIPLVSGLDTNQRVFALQHRGIGGDAIPHSTVEAAATSFIKAMTGIPLDGPIHLLGHSFGGWIAFEIALRSAGCGMSVASLTLVDPEPPDSDQSRIREYSGAEADVKWLELIQLLLERPVAIQAKALAFLDGDSRRKALHRLSISEGLLPPNSKPDVLLGPLRTFAVALRTTYTPVRQFEGRMRLLLVDRHRSSEARNIKESAELWKRWCPHMSFECLAGNHLTILKQPNVSELARVVRQQLSGYTRLPKPGSKLH